MGSIHEKNGGRKSRDTVSLNKGLTSVVPDSAEKFKKSWQTSNVVTGFVSYEFLVSLMNSSVFWIAIKQH